MYTLGLFCGVRRLPVLSIISSRSLYGTLNGEKSTERVNGSSYQGRVFLMSSNEPKCASQ